MLLWQPRVDNNANIFRFVRSSNDDYLHWCKTQHTHTHTHTYSIVQRTNPIWINQICMGASVLQLIVNGLKSQRKWIMYTHRQTLAFSRVFGCASKFRIDCQSEHQPGPCVVLLAKWNRRNKIIPTLLAYLMMTSERTKKEIKLIACVEHIINVLFIIHSNIIRYAPKYAKE